MKIYGPKLIIMEFATKHKSAKDFYRSLGAILAINDVIVIALNRNELSEELFVHESFWGVDGKKRKKMWASARLVTSTSTSCKFQASFRANDFTFLSKTKT